MYSSALPIICNLQSSLQINVFHGLYTASWTKFTCIALLDALKGVTTTLSLRAPESKDSLATQRLLLVIDILTSVLLLTADMLWAGAILTALQADFPGWASHDFRIYENLSGGMRMFMPRKSLQGDPDAPLWSRPDEFNDLNILAQLNTSMRMYESLHVSSLVVRVCTKQALTTYERIIRAFVINH